MQKHGRMIRSACAAVLILAAASAPAVAAARTLDAVRAVEDAVEPIADGDVGVSASALARVRIRFATARAALTNAGAAPADLAAVDSGLARLSREHGSAAIRTADALTDMLSPLFGVAGDRVPVDVHRLDHLARLMRLDAAAGTWRAAAGDAERASAAWSRVRGGAAARGAAVAARFDHGLAAVKAAIAARNAAASRAAASALSEDVDAVEKLYP